MNSTPSSFAQILLEDMDFGITCSLNTSREPRVKTFTEESGKC